MAAMCDTARGYCREVGSQYRVDLVEGYYVSLQCLGLDAGLALKPSFPIAHQILRGAAESLLQCGHAKAYRRIKGHRSQGRSRRRQAHATSRRRKS